MEHLTHIVRLTLWGLFVIFTGLWFAATMATLHVVKLKLYDLAWLGFTILQFFGMGAIMFLIFALTIK